MTAGRWIALAIAALALLVGGVVLAKGEDPQPEAAEPAGRALPREAVTQEARAPSAEDGAARRLPPGKAKRRARGRRAAPARADEASVRRSIERQLGGTAPVEERLRAFRCRGATCFVAYTSDSKGRGRALQEIGAFVRPILRDRRRNRVVVDVVHRRTSQGAKPQEVAFMRVTCRRIGTRVRARCRAGQKRKGVEKFGSRESKRTAKGTGERRNQPR